MLRGDTVRLVVEFKDFDGKTIHPENVTLKIYDTKQKLIETITDNIQQDGTKYYYDYTATDQDNNKYYYDHTAADSDFIFEFSGFYNDKIVLSRQLVKVKFNN